MDTTPTITPDDAATVTAEVVAVVADLERAQHAEDVDGFVALFHPDAVWVTAHGRRLVGRDEIAAFTATVLPGSQATTRSTYEVVHVAHVRPDVAIVGVRQVARSRDGVPLDEPEGRPTYVMARDETGWRLVGGQNTVVLA